MLFCCLCNGEAFGQIYIWRICQYWHFRQMVTDHLPGLSGSGSTSMGSNLKPSLIFLIKLRTTLCLLVFKPICAYLCKSEAKFIFSFSQGLPCTIQHTALLNSVVFKFSADRGKAMEQVVFWELRRRGNQINSYPKPSFYKT